jgi:Domain of unknown function (DUF1857)
MQFEHLIAITDPGNPLVVPVTREQIWSGLLQRVENPLPFLPGLESCAILERTSEGLLRELDFGPATLRDHVTMVEAQWVRFDIVPSATSAGGSLTINIEEPQPGFLFLRFAYRTALASDPEERAYVEYIKSAYHQSDVDCVRIIRTLAATITPL